MAETNDNKPKRKKKKMSPNSLANLISFADMTKEDLAAVQLKGKQTQAKKRREKMALQKCMRTLLEMDVKDDDKREMLKQMGFEDDEMSNYALVVASLLTGAVNGNVLAVKEIKEMSTELDSFEESGTTASQQVVININGVGNAYEPNDDDEQAIRDAEDDSDTADDDDDWGNEIYGEDNEG